MSKSFAEEDLQKCLRLVFETTSDLMAIIRVEGNEFRFVAFNPAWYKSVGSYVDECLGKVIREYLSPSELKKVRSYYREALETHRPVVSEDVYEISTGLLALETIISPVYDKQGIGTHLLAVCRDVTASYQERKRTEFLARVSSILLGSLDIEEVLGSVVKLAVSGIVHFCSIELMQDDGVMAPFVVAHENSELDLLASKEYFSLPYPFFLDESQWSKSIELSDTFHGSLSPEQYHFFSSLKIRSLIIEPISIRGKIQGIIMFGSEKPQSKNSLLNDAFAKDLSSRIALAVENSQLFKASEEAVRLREDFLALASHELKTPATSVELSIHLLERIFLSENEKGKPEKKVTALFDNLRRQMERQRRLIDNLLDISFIKGKGLKLKVEKVDLEQVTREVISQYSDELKSSGNSVEVSVNGPVEGNWDWVRIQELMSNLLSNAIKYAPRSPIHISIQGNSDEAVFKIKDFGPGIAQEDQKRIFDIFERAVSISNYGGFGLGLYICQEIVRAHGGTLTVESTIGQGATFTFRLPK